MKTLKLVVLGIVLIFAGATQAQISVRFNIGSPPAWGPAGYSDVRYYYLPDVQAYYDVLRRCLFTTKEDPGCAEVICQAATETMICTTGTRW